ncbi:MAG TPA: hypothetical protein VGG91_15030 [Myxococcaceae bacterium]
MGEREQQFREHLWHDLESEHRSLARVLVDVECLVEDGSFETARRRFGEYRLAHERHLIAEQKLEEVCAGVREVAAFLTQLQRERSRVLEQSERVWTYLCREKGAPVRRMLDRLASLVAEHENAQRRLILADLPLSAERRNAQGEVVRRLGHL